MIVLAAWLCLLAGLTIAPGGPAAAQTTAPSPSPAGAPAQVAVPPASQSIGTPESPGQVSPSPSPTPAGPPLAGLQGVLVETMDGKILIAQSTEQTFNPASAVKLATALDALRTYGPDHRFTTGIWTNGTLDRASGTLTGDLIISGGDPSLHYEHAVMLARALNDAGIRTVTGDLIVSPRFTMNFDWSAQRSGDALYDTLDVTRRPAAATAAWLAERALTRDESPGVPSVAVMGAVYVNSVPANARLLLIQHSSRLADILKVLLCYSNNFMAERVGDTLGGADGLRRFLVNDLGINQMELHLSSTSGLGVNRMTPRAMMKVYRALLDELSNNRMTASDILPVAGIDPGTLEKRYAAPESRGSVVAKTGTLTHTDGGASALVGQLRAANGETLLFVILGQHGNVHRFRERQDQLVSWLQNERGGPAPFAYQSGSLALRLAAIQFNAALPASQGSRADEFEP